MFMACKPSRAIVSGLFAAAVLTAGLTLPARAASLIDEKSIPGTFSANVAFTSEYYFRGISQTDDKPAVQGGFDYGADFTKNVGVYLGIWGSNVDFNEDLLTPPVSPGATMELDGYGGLNGKIPGTPLSWTAGFIYYAYPGAKDTLNEDYVEVQGSLAYDFGVATATASLNYSPDYWGASGDAYYPKFALEVPIGDYFTLSGYVARQWIANNAAFGYPDYLEWNLTGSVNIAGFDVALTYSDTDLGTAFKDNAGSKAIVTVSRSF